MKTIEYSRLTTWAAPRIEGKSRQLEGVLYAAAGVAALVTRTVQDDAFISFRYARNLSQGHGLVFNPGERTEGYTNFLWTLIDWIPEHFGWSAPGFSIVVTVPLMVITVALALRLARKVFDNEALAFLSALALVANMSFLGYGTTGLETMLQTMLVTAVGLLLVPDGGEADAPHLSRTRVIAGVVGAFAVLTRIDSGVIVGAWFLVHLWWLHRHRQQPFARLATAALQLGVPLVALLTPWVVWKVGYYDALLPNTLQAKSWSNPWVPFLFGIFYLLCFFGSYVAFLLIGRYRRVRGTFPAAHATWALVAVVAAWFVYICVVGADFMEFRFVVPVIPILAMLAAYLIDHVRTRARQIALVGFMLFVSGLHIVAPTIIPYPVLTFQELKHWPLNEANSWQSFGEMLHREFPGGVDAPGQPVLGIIPAGAVPYYAQLPAIDMLGLNDEWTAENGLQYPIYFPGHVRTSTIAYLQERDVSLLLGSMREGLIDPDRESYRLSELVDVHPAGDLQNLPPHAQALEIPTGTPGRAWRFIYLEQNDKVDAAIERNDWRLIPIEMVCEPADIENAFAQLFAERTCPSD